MEDLNAIKKDKTINDDRLRYEKNSIPSLFCYLAIVFDVIYFVSIYKINDEFFYDKLMAVSVVCNLIFLLASFLSSEEIKNYKKNFSFVMIGLSVLQIARIFIYPTKAHSTASKSYVNQMVMSDKTFALTIVLLVLSAACLIAGAVIGIIRCNRLEKRLKEIKKGE